MYNKAILYLKTVKTYSENDSTTDIPTIKDHHKNSRIIAVDKLHRRELYSFFITNVEHQLCHKLTLINFFQMKFGGSFCLEMLLLIVIKQLSI